jgi:hypothetical protein
MWCDVHSVGKDPHNITAVSSASVLFEISTCGAVLDWVAYHRLWGHRTSCRAIPEARQIRRLCRTRIASVRDFGLSTAGTIIETMIATRLFREPPAKLNASDLPSE